MDSAASPSLARSPRAMLEQQEAQGQVYSSYDRTNLSRRGVSYSFRELLQPGPVEKPVTPQQVAPPLPRRSSARLRSDYPSRRMASHIHRRRVSLETIDSVTTSHSTGFDEDEDEDEESVEGTNSAYASTDTFTLEQDPRTTPELTRPPSATTSTDTSSTCSRQSSLHPVTNLDTDERGPRSPRAIFHKMTHRKAQSMNNLPERLIIERRISIDRSSHHSDGSKSHQSWLPDDPATSGSFNEDNRRPSASSSEWSASSFDTTGLTETELRKCKKKGINPSLYAEMKAARKGKWTSPITGNSFL